jgi:hypothetical protein
MVEVLPQQAEAPVEPPQGFRSSAPPQQVTVADVFDCVVEAAHRVGNGDAADFACGRHRFEVVAAHWRREPNLPIYDLPAGNGHVCNEVRALEAGAA